jgi:hypothetical protein
MMEWLIIGGIVIYALSQQSTPSAASPSAETPHPDLDPAVGELLGTVPNPATRVRRQWEEPAGSAMATSPLSSPARSPKAGAYGRFGAYGTARPGGPYFL